MAIPNPWRRHYQSHFRAMSADTRLALCYRLAFLAYGSARCNGHANFQPGELAEHFDKPGPRISEALKGARDRGLIGLDSTTQCLVVPVHVAEGGDGHPFEICGVHDAARRIGRQRRPRKLAKVIPIRPGDTLAEAGEERQAEKCSATPGVARSDANTAAPCLAVSEQPPDGENSEVGMKVAKGCAMVGCVEPPWGYGIYCHGCRELERKRLEAERDDPIYAKGR